MDTKEKNKRYHIMLVKGFYITIPLIFISIIGIILVNWGMKIQIPFEMVQKKMFSKIDRMGDNK